MRAFVFKFHRYFGITIGIFILIASLTGSFIAFYHPLDAFINPWQKSEIKADVTPSDPLTHIALIESRVENAKVGWMSLSLSHQSSWLYFLEGVNPKKLPANNEVYVDPYTNEIKGMRSWGDIRQGITNLMPFLYALHYSLALGTFGTGLMGFFALFWVVTLLIGVYMTFPRKNASFFEQWKRAWHWKKTQGWHAKHYHWHKTGGLWFLGFMLIIAYSSFALNLPILHQKFLGEGHFQKAHEQIKELKKPLHSPKIGWFEAREKGRAHMSALARQEGFEIVEESWIMYEPEQGVYVYGVKSSRDISNDHGQTKLYFDANTGKKIAYFIPTGKAWGDTFTQWLYGLHQGSLFGLPHRIVLCFVGILSCFFVISGFYLWWKKVKFSRTIKQKE